MCRALSSPNCSGRSLLRSCSHGSRASCRPSDGRASAAIELPYAIPKKVADIDQSVGTDRDTGGISQRLPLVARRCVAPYAEQLPVRRELLYPMVEGIGD